MYFLVLTLSSVVFLLVFWRNIYALIVLLAALLAYFLELHVALFNESMPTFPGMRHGSTLALIPMWYFVFLVGRKISLGAFLGALIQLAIFILAWRIRGSAAWMFVFIAIVSLTAAGYTWFRQGREARAWPLLLRGMLAWPLILLLAGVVANSAYMRIALHQVYFTDDILPYHGAWHSAYLGFFPIPEVVNPYAAELFRKGQADAAGQFGGLGYVKETHFMDWKEGHLKEGSFELPIPYLSPLTAGPKIRLHDDVMRRLVIETILKNPGKMLWLYGYYKPWYTVQIVKAVFVEAPDRQWLWFILAGAGVLFALLVMSPKELSAAGVGKIVVLGSGAAMIAALPNLWAYAGRHTSADLVLTLLTVAPLLLATLGAAVWIACRAEWVWASRGSA